MKQFILRSYLLLVSTFGAVELFQSWLYGYGDYFKSREGPLLDELLSLPNRHDSKSVKTKVTASTISMGVTSAAIRPATATATATATSSSNSTSRIRSSRFEFRTVDGRPLPGTFYENQLYFMGARLTTSYENNDVAITLFGIPGQTRYPKDGSYFCGNSELDQSIWSRGVILRKLWLYTQLECRLPNRTGTGTGTEQEYPYPYPYQPCGPPISMQRIETTSWDVNVNKISLIWQANVTDWFNRDDWRRGDDATNKNSAVRVMVWASEGRRPRHTVEEMTSVFTVDIPLTTGAIGHVAPQDYFDRMGEPSTYLKSASGASAATLCANVYGKEIHHYIPEFLQHHQNMGFEQIVLGVLDYEDYARSLAPLESLLEPFLRSGQVVLMPASVPGLRCNTQLLQVEFYNACLYHAKGVSEFVAIWDIDEYWIPLSSPTNNHPVKEEQPMTANSSTASGAASATSFPPPPPPAVNRLRDSMWKASPYATRSHSRTSGIQETMALLTDYHKRNGCFGESWCFHAFPSFTVHRRQQPLEGGQDYNKSAPGGRRISDVFYQRDTDSNQVWVKSIAKTSQVFAAGIHEFGSCRRQRQQTGSSRDETYGDRPWHVSNPGLNQSLRQRPYEDDASSHPTCRNLRIDGFGNMHHFKTLIKRRGPIPNLTAPNSLQQFPLDEYSRLYGPMVQQQLQNLGY